MCAIASHDVTVYAVASSRRKAEQVAAADVLSRAAELLPLPVK